MKEDVLRHAPPPDQAAPRLAALTLDLEYDFGSRTGRFDVVRDTQGLDRLKDFLVSHRIPLSAFTVSGLVEKESAAREFIADVHAEVHSHTHTHAVDNPAYELEASRDILSSMFGLSSIGYRAPYGAVDRRQIEIAAELGYAFSSSVFPSFRPGKFNNLRLPVGPFCHPNGLIELPMATVRTIRVILSVSYLKLLGWPFFNTAMSRFGLPPVVIIDSHLHDFLRTPSIDLLPAHMKYAWSLNRDQGLPLTEKLVQHLTRAGYRFVTMNEIHQVYADEGIVARS